MPNVHCQQAGKQLETVFYIAQAGPELSVAKDDPELLIYFCLQSATTSLEINPLIRHCDTKTQIFRNKAS